MIDPYLSIEVPALGEYLSVLRTAATALAAQLSFTYEEIDDLRIAVDEACTQLLAGTDARALRVTYGTQAGQLSVDVTALGAHAAQPLDRGTLGWQVLSALTEQLHERDDDDGARLSFAKRGGVA